VPVLRPLICQSSHQLHRLDPLFRLRPTATVLPRREMEIHRLLHPNPAMGHHPKMAMENPRPVTHTCHQAMAMEDLREAEEQAAVVVRIYPSLSWSPRSTPMVLIW